MERVTRGRRILSVGIVLGAIAALVSGCVGNAAVTKPGEVIPAALLASDLGAVSAYASTTKDGFATDLFVQIEFDRDAVTSDELATALRLIVENSGGASYHMLNLVGTFDGDLASGVELDLSSVGEQLGFDPTTQLSDISFNQDFERVTSIVAGK